MTLAALLAGMPAVASAAGQDWRPANGPLMTRWAKEVSPDCVLPEYPRPQMVRQEWLNLNGVWQVAIGAADETPPIGKELAGRILVPFPIESALSGVMKRADRLWYRRTFQRAPAWRADRRVLLHFGAVDWEATVWVNGRGVGTHRGGYDAFSFDITEALKESGEQELVVGVYDPTSNGTQPRGKQVDRPEGIWYAPSTGIWRTVWLEPVPAARIGSLKLVPDVDASCLRIKVHGIGLRPEHVMEAVALDGGREVARTSGAGDLTLTIPNARLWSPDDPFLYDLRLALRDNGDPAQAVDAVHSYFGMRRVAIDTCVPGTPCILLNGEPLFQLGVLDQGFWPDGLYTAPTDEALRYDIETIKKLGFNLIRKHVKVEPERWYYWCDRLGVLVWQDMPSGDRYIGPGDADVERSPESARQFEHELQRVIADLYNHPAVIMWVIFNEGWGQYDTARLTRWVKELDPTRLTNSASGWTDRGVGDVLDIHAYPGPACPPMAGGRAAVLGEFGGLGLLLEGHTWSSQENWGYRKYQSTEELTQNYLALIDRLWCLSGDAGLSAAVYTQATDVETEVNGLLTYDRKVSKLDAERVVTAHRRLLSGAPVFRVLAPTCQQEGTVWRFTTAQPASGWYQPGFDDRAWNSGPGGFGTEHTPGGLVRTVWNTNDIWLRREFTLPAELPDKLYFLVHHDEDVEIYVNGVLAARASEYATAYEPLAITAEDRAAFKPGRNVMAVHCRQTVGGQYIDVGLTEVTSQPRRRVR